MSTLNEFAIGLAAPVPDSASVVGDTSAMAIGTPDTCEPKVADASKISVYANSITPVSYGDSDAVVAFDVVFSVGVACEGSSKTYQVVKRIGIDKIRIAAEAEKSVPMSIVESTQPKPEVVKNAISVKEQMRRLAGI